MRYKHREKRAVEIFRVGEGSGVGFGLGWWENFKENSAHFSFLPRSLEYNKSVGYGVYIYIYFLPPFRFLFLADHPHPQPSSSLQRWFLPCPTPFYFTPLSLSKNGVRYFATSNSVRTLDLPVCFQTAQSCRRETYLQEQAFSVL